MHFVGIDWADENHQVAVVNEEGKVVLRISALSINISEKA